MKKKILGSLLTGAAVAAVFCAGSVMAEDPVTIRWVLYGEPCDGDERVEEELNKILREKINVELDMDWIGGGEYDQKTLTMITSGEDYDLVWTSNWSNDWMANVAREAFLPLNDLLETEAGQAIRASLPDWIFGSATVNGNIYCVPNYQNMVDTVGVFVQKDIADEYGLTDDHIDSIHELEPFWDWCVENYPDMIPLMEYDWLRNTTTELGDKYDGMYLTTILKDDTDDVKAFYELDGYKENRELLNTYYKKGYLRSDVLTVTDNTPERFANKYISYVNVWIPGGDAKASARYGKDYICIPVGEDYVSSTMALTTMTGLNVNSRNPEKAIELLSLFYTDKEVFNLACFGMEGIDYNKIGENRIELIADSGYSHQPTLWTLGNNCLAYLYGTQEDGLWELTDKRNKETTASTLMGFAFDPTPVETELANLTAVHKEYEGAMVVAEDYDAIYEEYVAALKSAGIETFIEEQERQLAEWKAANES